MLRPWVSFLILLFLVPARAETWDANDFQELVNQIESSIRSMNRLEGENSCRTPATDDAKKRKDPKPVLPGGIPICEKNRAPLFSEDSILDLEIEADLNQVPGPAQFQDRETNLKRSHPAKIRFQDSNGAKKEIQIGLLRRSKSRFYSCDFKPLKLVFPEDLNLENTIFDRLKADEMKLVVHCGYTSGKIEENPKKFNEDIKEEYAVYKFLKALGYPVPEVRLVKVNYKKPGGEFVVEGLGILIEPKGSLGKRCACGHAKGKGLWDPIIPADTDPTIYAGLLFAERIAASGDWIAKIGHNVIPLTCDEKVVGLAPYDFNDSALVSARGATYNHLLQSGARFFRMISRGPFDRDDRPTVDLNDREKWAWNKAIRSEAARLIVVKSRLYAALDQADIQNKEHIREHFDNFYAHLEKWLAQEIGIRNVARSVQDKAKELKQLESGN
ncbi:MAG: hypothetical protein JNL01_01970 [Bdellovibrionales bacterium]|nr:hypothetical protein [Bdellovibrionales bacterium]